MERKIEFTSIKITFYIHRIALVRLGVNLMSRSGLGLGAWDTVTFNLNELLNESITKGMTSWIISLIIMTFVIVYNKKWVLLFMLVPVFMVGISIDFWDLIVFGKEYAPDSQVVKVLFFIVGAGILPLGLASVVTSHFPAFVFDELTLVVMDMFKLKTITVARLGIEVLGILLGILFGFLAGIGFGYVSIGSIIFALILPPLFDFYVRMLGRFHHAENHIE